MKKEVIIAIIIGFGIGLAITFGIYQAQKSYVNQTVSDLESTSVSSPTPEPQPEHYLDIVAPEDFGLVETDVVTITGFTSPEAYVTILSENDEVIVQANQAGSFTTEFELEENANILSLTALDADGNKVETSLTITYLLNDNQFEEIATDDDETIEE